MSIEKNKIKFQQKFFASPNLGTPHTYGCT